MYSEKRALPAFHSIILKGIGNVYIQQGDKHSVEIASNQDIYGKIRTKVQNGELIISFRDPFPVWLISMPRLDITVTAGDIMMCKVKGAGKMVSREMLKGKNIQVINTGVGSMFLEVEARALTTILKGVGEIEIRGRAEQHHVEVSGTGKINAYDLEARDVTVDSRGVGECIVHATGTLDVNSSGIGRVKYRGSPILNSRQSGLGRIEKIS
ncbi:MAG: head GIN domain-containing protein [Bacteroidales bacterium]